MTDNTRIPLIGQAKIVQPDGMIQSNFQSWLNRAFSKIHSQIADIAAAATTAIWTGVSGTGKPEDNADITSIVVVDDDHPVIAADYTGTVKAGQLPLTTSLSLVKVGTTISSGITWTYTVVTGGVNGFTSGSGAQSISGTGSTVFTLTTLDTPSATINVTASYGGRDRVWAIVFTTSTDAPPATAGGGGTTVSDTTVSPSGSASYGSANTSVLTVKTGTAGTITFTAPLTFTTATSSTGGGVYGKWQYSAAGAGVYSDVATEINSTIFAVTSGTGRKTAGSVKVNMSKSGLTASTDYDVRLLMRNDANFSTTARSYIGTASATGS